MMYQTRTLTSCLLALLLMKSVAFGQQAMRPITLRSQITNVQPMTGIVLWTTNDKVETAPIQLEYTYLRYDQVVSEKGMYDWSVVDQTLQEIAERGHQGILRWHDTYVGKPTGVPASIKALPDYRETQGISESKQTGFPDWSHPRLQAFVLEFFERFAERYDRDPRLAFVQVGFGLWSEYHIYDGPMELGKTFPSKAFQSDFALHMNRMLKETPWMISVDAAGDHTPFADNPELLALPFGVFDDSFNHAKHRQENEPNWDTFDRQRWKIAPAGGEFSFFQPSDQKKALSPKGPHGVSFEEQAAKFHVSFIIGDDQPRFQTPKRIREASLACGYRFRVTEFSASNQRARVTVINEGIAPIYYDAFPSVNGIRATESLRGLLPGASNTFQIDAGGLDPRLTIECDRLVPGQHIQFDAELP